MKLSECGENQENQPHSCKKQLDPSTCTVKSGLVNTLTGLTPRPSHGGLLSPRNPNVNTAATNNQMKESNAQVDIKGVAHARRHVQPVEHEPALNVIMPPIQDKKAHEANGLCQQHQQSQLNKQSSATASTSTQILHPYTCATEKQSTKSISESRVSQVTPILYSGRRRCSNHRADSLNLFATRASSNQTSAHVSAQQKTHIDQQVQQTIQTNKQIENKNRSSSSSQTRDANNTQWQHKRTCGKMLSDKLHNVTQTSQQRAMSFLHNLCDIYTSNNHLTKNTDRRNKISEDVVGYAHQLLDTINTNVNNSIDVVKQVDKMQRRIASDAFAAKSEYKSTTQTPNNDDAAFNCFVDENNRYHCKVQEVNHIGDIVNTCSIKTRTGMKHLVAQRASSSCQTKSPSPVPVYVRIGKNSMDHKIDSNNSEQDECHNIVNTTRQDTSQTIRKQLYFASKTPPPQQQQKQQQTSSSSSSLLPHSQFTLIQRQDEEHENQSKSIHTNMNNDGGDNIYNAQYAPPPAVGVRSPFFKRKMLVKPNLHPYPYADSARTQANVQDTAVSQSESRASSSRRARHNVQCTQDYDTLALKRARARGASKSQQQRRIHVNNSNDIITNNNNDDNNNNSTDNYNNESNTCPANSSVKRVRHDDNIATSHQLITANNSEVTRNKDNTATTNNDTNCNESVNNHSHSQRGQLGRQMQNKWKAREEDAQKHKSGRALTGQNYQKTSLW